MAMITKHFRNLDSRGFHAIAYTEWATPGRRSDVICVHGLTRNGRDFDFLASALHDNRRFICPDIAGRGDSDWLADTGDYGYPVYLSDMAALIARLDTDRVDWIGTSMGGIIGMMLASQPNTPIRSLVVNDIGPFLPKAALTRISGYVGHDGDFSSLDAVETYLRQVHAPFGPLTDKQWSHLTRHGAREVDEGRWRLHYDPAIGTAFKAAATDDVDLWAIWDRIRCPVLVLRGTDSDILSSDTAAEMVRRGPPVELVEFPDIGHAPALMDDSQIAIIREWLNSNDC